ncbi:MAG: zinc ribbon domain-containing protein [Bacteroides uniformis]|uniref:zinc ribbon domain-containing protein n=1 Tax=Bacteroides sp. AF34-31BH TaxID=2292931 RepID=UPI000EC33FB4|nr:zinc ribbon domain-containing protein [Bacteroides sp. AF34-31BH]RJV07678.1 zinc ribbon domain-containing protein [Bacteroides sp. AF34-31BH]
MALMKCSECGNMVSDKAASCPKCGAPVVIPIKCEECGEIVPPSSISCPNCGAPFKPSMIKCEECGQMIPCGSKSCPYCGIPVNDSVNQPIMLNNNSSSLLRIMRIGKIPLASVTLEIQSNGKTIGIYPFNVGFDMDIPVLSNMILNIKCQGVNTPIKLTLDTNENYICKISYSTSFSYELYNGNGVLLKKDKLGIGMWILSFLIPIVGIIYYFIKKKEFPVKAKNALVASLMGLAVNIIRLLFF